MDMDFFGVGPLEILFILLIAFVIFGPKRIFDISRNAGRAMREISRTASGFSTRLEKEIGDPSSIDVKQGSAEKKRGATGE